MSVVIYHNPRCSKSRKALELLENKQINISVKEYLKEGLSKEEILELSKILGISVHSFLRTKEEDYKNYSFSEDDDDGWAQALVKAPKILERPIVINGKKGVVARPPELLEELF